MKRHSLSDASNHDVRRGLHAAVSAERGNTAEVLVHIAEFDERKLYLPEAYSSMYEYCVGALHLSGDAAYKRIRAARAARRFPVLFDAVADGRLHLAAVVLLSPHLTHETVHELIAAATHKKKSEIELMLAARFPQPDVITCLRPVTASGGVGTAQVVSEPMPVPEASIPTEQLAPGPVVPSEDAAATPPMRPLAPLADTLPRARMAPRSPGRFALQVMLEQQAHDRIRYAMDLLGQRITPGDIAAVIDRAMVLLVAELEREKLAATERPRSHRRRIASGSRYIPAHVKRDVWRRDQGRCTFVSESGRAATEVRAAVKASPG